MVRNSPVATYRAFGPLASLRFDLGTDRDETRGYDFRYAPTSIAVSGSLFHWAYTNDLAGNVTAIQQTLPTPTVSRTYGYQEWQSYLACAAGPWNLSAASCNPATNSPIEWTYDRVGNRLRLSLLREAGGRLLVFLFGSPSGWWVFDLYRRGERVRGTRWSSGALPYGRPGDVLRRVQRRPRVDCAPC